MSGHNADKPETWGQAVASADPSEKGEPTGQNDLNGSSLQAGPAAQGELPAAAPTPEAGAWPLEASTAAAALAAEEPDKQEALPVPERTVEPQAEINSTAAAGKKQKKRPAGEIPPHFPPLRVEPQAPATVLSRIFELGALISPLLLSAVLIAEVFFGLQELRLLWMPEAEQAEVLRNALGGDWMILMLNGQVYFEAPPLYFWFLAGVHQLLALPAVQAVFAPAADGVAQAMFFGAALSGLLLLWAVLCLARFVAGLDRRGVFAAGCVLLGMFLFSGSLHYAAPHLFFAALVTFSQVFMFQALRRSSSMPLMGAAFSFAALASLTEGPLGLALPLASAVLFAIWQGKPWRLLRKDFLLGFAFSLLPAIIWIGSIWAAGHHQVVIGLFREQFWGTLLNSLRYPESWWYYLVLLPLLLLPWVLLVFFPHWGGLFSKELRAALKGAFRGDHQGLSFVWIALACALAAFFLLSPKSPLNLLPLFGPLAIIGGRLALGLSPLRNMLLQRCYAVLFILAALIFAVVPVYMSGTAPEGLNWLGGLGLPVIGTEVGGVFVLAAMFLAAGCLFLGAVNSRRPEGTLLILLLLALCISYPLSVLTAPSLDKVLSPAGPSLEIGKFARQGFKAYALDVDPAPFVYYAGNDIRVLPTAGGARPLERLDGDCLLLSSAEFYDKIAAELRLEPVASAGDGPADRRFASPAPEALDEPPEERSDEPATALPVAAPDAAPDAGLMAEPSAVSLDDEASADPPAREISGEAPELSAQPPVLPGPLEASSGGDAARQVAPYGLREVARFKLAGVGYVLLLKKGFQLPAAEPPAGPPPE